VVIKKILTHLNRKDASHAARYFHRLGRYRRRLPTTA
jgi:hypothetical protein